MKINIDYARKEPATKTDKWLSNQELTFEYISQAVVSSYGEKGIEGSLRRIWGRIQRKFDDAIDANADTIELEQAEQDFIKTCVEKAKFHPIVAKYVQVLENEIESWKTA